MKLSPQTIIIASYLLLFGLNLLENLFYFRLGNESRKTIPSYSYFGVILLAMFLFALLQYYLLPNLRWHHNSHKC